MDRDGYADWLLPARYNTIELLPVDDDVSRQRGFFEPGYRSFRYNRHKRWEKEIIEAIPCLAE